MFVFLFLFLILGLIQFLAEGSEGPDENFCIYYLPWGFLLSIYLVYLMNVDFVWKDYMTSYVAKTRGENDKWQCYTKKEFKKVIKELSSDKDYKLIETNEIIQKYVIPEKTPKKSYETAKGIILFIVLLIVSIGWTYKNIFDVQQLLSEKYESGGGIVLLLGIFFIIVGFGGIIACTIILIAGIIEAIKGKRHGKQ